MSERTDNLVYVPSLQFAKFCFIMMIVLSHFFPHFDADFEVGGNCGVVMFFVLSGFGLSAGYGAKTLGNWNNLRFVLSRVRKFYRLHLFTLLAFVVISYRHSLVEHIPHIVLNALLLQSWLPDENYYFSGNAVAWFLSSLLLSYVLFRWLYRWLDCTSWLSMWLRLSLMLVAYFIAVQFVRDDMVYIHPILRVPNFAMGIVAYRLCVQCSRSFTPWRADFLMLLSIALVVLAMVVRSQLPYRYGCSSLFWIPSILLVVAFYVGGLSRCRLHSLFSHPACVWLGNQSFNIFILHMLIVGPVSQILHYIF